MPSPVQIPVLVERSLSAAPVARGSIASQAFERTLRDTSARANTETPAARNERGALDAERRLDSEPAGERSERDEDAPAGEEPVDATEASAGAQQDPEQAIDAPGAQSETQQVAPAGFAHTPGTVHDVNAEILLQSRWALNLLRGQRADGQAPAESSSARRANSEGGVGRDAYRDARGGASGVETRVGEPGSAGRASGPTAGAQREVGAGSGEERAAAGRAVGRAQDLAEAGDRARTPGSTREDAAGSPGDPRADAAKAVARADQASVQIALRAQAVREAVVQARPQAEAVKAGAGDAVRAVLHGTPVNAAAVKAVERSGQAGTDVGKDGGAASRSSGASQTSGAEPGQIAQSAAVRAQALRGLATAVSRGETAMTIRLDPGRLGAMRIEVDVQEGRVDASFRVSTREAQRLLSDSLGDLRRELDARGMDVGRLEVVKSERSEVADAHLLRDEPGLDLGADGSGAERSADQDRGFDRGGHSGGRTSAGGDRADSADAIGDERDGVERLSGVLGLALRIDAVV